jgi:hypothetical protein
VTSGEWWFLGQVTPRTVDPVRGASRANAIVDYNSGAGGQLAAPADRLTPDFIENHRAGKLRVVAVLPDVPTFPERGWPASRTCRTTACSRSRGVPAAFIIEFAAAMAKVLAQRQCASRCSA